MIKIFLVTLLFLVSLQATQIDKKWATSQNCKGCHTNITSKWETSRHANSHYSKNDLFKQSLEYMAIKNPTKLTNEIKLECAKCHNPRITLSKVTTEDRFSLLFQDKNTTKTYNQAFESDNMKNGINCIVCHNIDKINFQKKHGSLGMNNVYFGKQGTMFGPFSNAKSPYHKTQKRQHFEGDNPKLCFSCHYSYKNKHNLLVYETGIEYDKINKLNNGKNPGCKSCHMSQKQEGYASNYAPDGQKPIKRMVRVHRFASIDNSNIMNDYLDMKGTVDDNYFIIKLTNHAPHKIPTGYGLREVILRVVFLDKDDKPIKTNEYILGSKWVDEKGSPTIPHLAVKRVKDTRMNGKSTNAYKFPIPKGAVYAKYSLSYRLISDGLAKEIGVTDPFFLREYTFAQMRIHL